MQQQLNTGLVFVNDYQPGVPLQVVSRMQQTTVNQILGGQQDGQPVVDPTDYNGYIYNYQGCGGGNYGLAFVRETNLQQGQTYSFATDATFFNNQIQLLEATLQRGGGGGGGNQTQGGNVTGNQTDTNVTADNQTDGNVTDANATAGNQTDGNATGGNVTADNRTGGNVTDANATDDNQTGDLNVTINTTEDQTGG